MEAVTVVHVLDSCHLLNEVVQAASPLLDKLVLLVTLHQKALYCDLLARYGRNVAARPLLLQPLAQHVEIVEPATNLKAAEFVTAGNEVSGEAAGLVELGILNCDGNLRRKGRYCEVVLDGELVALHNILDRFIIQCVGG